MQLSEQQLAEHARRLQEQVDEAQKNSQREVETKLQMQLREVQDAQRTMAEQMKEQRDQYEHQLKRQGALRKKRQGVQNGHGIFKIRRVGLIFFGGREGEEKRILG